MNAYSSVSPVYGQAFLNAILAAYKTAPVDPLVKTAKIRLSHDPAFNPGPSMTVADLAAQEVLYSGYAAGGIAVVLSAPINLAPTVQGVLDSVLFLATSATPFVSDTATGYWVDDGTKVIMAERFADGQTAGFGAAGDFLELTALLPQRSGQAAA